MQRFTLLITIIGKINRMGVKPVKRRIALLLALLMLLSLVSCKMADVGSGAASARQTDAPEHNADNSDVSAHGEADEKQQPAEGDVISYCDFLYRHMTADEMYEAADIVAVVEYTGQSSVVQPDSAEEGELLYTYQTVKPHRIIKGSADGNIRVRRIGGQLGNIYYDSNEPELKAGKKYLLFLEEIKPVNESDAQSYRALSGSLCYTVYEDGKLDESIIQSEEVERMYEILNSSK